MNQEQIEAIQRERDEMREVLMEFWQRAEEARDAARYRWLRKRENAATFDMLFAKWYVDSEQLDSMIDAAMAEEGKHVPD